MHGIGHIIKLATLCVFLFSSSIILAQIDQIDVDSKEYVEWVGTCETPEIEKAMSQGLESLTSFEKIKYYIDYQKLFYSW